MDKNHQNKPIEIFIINQEGIERGTSLGKRSASWVVIPKTAETFSRVKSLYAIVLT